MCTSSLPDASSDEVMDSASSWQSFNTSDLANQRPGYFPRDKISGHSSHLVSRVTKGIRGELDGAPPQCAQPSGLSAQNQTMYHPHDTWRINTTPPPLHPREASYGPPAANGTTAFRYDDSSSSDSQLSGGSYAHHHLPDRYLPPPSTSGFTPINQHGSTAPFFPSSSSKASRPALC